MYGIFEGKKLVAEIEASRFGLVANGLADILNNHFKCERFSIKQTDKTIPGEGVFVLDEGETIAVFHDDYFQYADIVANSIGAMVWTEDSEEIF